MNRRAFLRNTVTSLAACASRVPGQQPPGPVTYTYKTAAGCDMKADVYGADDSAKKPGVLWIHGGALIMGSRKSGPARQPKEELLKAGYVVASIDYRLAPETKLAAIIEDLQDAYAWMHGQGPKLFHLDPDRLAVAGGSAGGYLTLMAGFRVKPRPRALVSFWGYGDLTAPWYTRPDAFYSQQPAVPADEARGSVGTQAVAEPAPKNQRGRFYLYCRQHGIWPREVAGHDPDIEPRWFDPYCPVRNVTAQYPPTLLIHGTADTDVPYEESVKMARALAQAGVAHELMTVAGAGHGLGGAKPEEIAQANAKAVQFIRKYTQR